MPVCVAVALRIITWRRGICLGFPYMRVFLFPPQENPRKRSLHPMFFFTMACIFPQFLTCKGKKKEKHRYDHDLHTLKVECVPTDNVCSACIISITLGYFSSIFIVIISRNPAAILSCSPLLLEIKECAELFHVPTSLTLHKSSARGIEWQK